MLIPFLIQEMSKLIPNDGSVDVNELDELINNKQIPIRTEHRQFLIKYGNCKTLLNNGFSDFTFKQFKNHYLDNELFYTDRIPFNTVYIGIDFADELVCIDNENGIIYVYGDQKKEGIYYDNLESLLFICFMRSDYLEKAFDIIRFNIKIFIPREFLRKNEKHKIHDIQGKSYYLIGNKLYSVDNYIYKSYYNVLGIFKVKYRFIMVNVYEGGVINDYLRCYSARAAH